jgi:uncharacterized protein
MNTAILIERDVMMEMRDGTLLRADVYRPHDKEKHPAILRRSPYNAHMLPEWSFLPSIETVSAGFAYVFQNIRGTFGSEGKHGLGASFSEESSDGYDSIEWIASQPWCDGNVGTAGGSYEGSLQWITAIANPPHLKAMAPWVSGAATSEPSTFASAINLNLITSWVLAMSVDVIEWLEKQGKDVSAVRPLIKSAMTNPEEIYNYLPLKDVPHFKVEGLKEIWLSRLKMPEPNPKATEKNRTQYEKVSVPCFHISGWFDFFTSGTFNNFLSMKERGGSRLARESQHILVGPWLHMGPSLTGNPIDINFGPLANTFESNIINYNLAFFNKYLKGMEVDLPPVRCFVMGKNEWRNSSTWPLPQTNWQRFFLHSQGRANTSWGNGVLNRDEPQEELIDIFIYNPHFPVPTTGCKGHTSNQFAASPKDQSGIEKREDILCYTTPELKTGIEITGPLELHLFAATSARDTDFTAKLVDVYPDGRSFDITSGIIRARYRKSLFAPELVKPDEVNEYVINLEATSQLFRKGHRIRIDVSSSSFPEYDRNMNIGNPVGEDTIGIPAMQSVYHNRNFSSYIDFPVIES